MIGRRICFLPCHVRQLQRRPLCYVPPACSLTHLRRLLTPAGVLHHCRPCLDASGHLLSSSTCRFSTPALCRPRGNSCFLPPAPLVWQQEIVLFYLLCLLSRSVSTGHLLAAEAVCSVYDHFSWRVCFLGLL